VCVCLGHWVRRGRGAGPVEGEEGALLATARSQCFVTDAARAPEASVSAGWPGVHTHNTHTHQSLSCSAHLWLPQQLSARRDVRVIQDLFKAPETCCQLPVIQQLTHFQPPAKPRQAPSHKMQLQQQQQMRLVAGSSSTRRASLHPPRAPQHHRGVHGLLVDALCGGLCSKRAATLTPCALVRLRHTRATGAAALVVRAQIVANEAPAAAAPPPPPPLQQQATATSTLELLPQLPPGHAALVSEQDAAAAGAGSCPFLAALGEPPMVRMPLYKRFWQLTDPYRMQRELLEDTVKGGGSMVQVSGLRVCVLCAVLGAQLARAGALGAVSELGTQQQQQQQQHLACSSPAPPPHAPNRLTHTNTPNPPHRLTRSWALPPATSLALPTRSGQCLPARLAPSPSRARP
jgi:hypothetical protein